MVNPGLDHQSDIKTVHVLFVCYANICRSPIAEALFRKTVFDAGLSNHIFAASAGVSYTLFDTKIHEQSRQILRSHGIEFEHTPRRLVQADLESFDYILALDSPVLRSVWSLSKGRAKVEHLMKYSAAARYQDIPDPMRTNDFDLVFDMVSSAMDLLLKTIRAQYKI